MPREQLVGSSRLDSKQIYRRSSRTGAEKETVKKPFEGKKTKRIVGQGRGKNLFLLVLPDPGGNGGTGCKVCEESSLLKSFKRGNLMQFAGLS